MISSVNLKSNNLLRRIGKNFSIGVFGSALLLLISLGRTAMLTKYLMMADYGRILIILNFFGLLTLVFGLRVNDFIYRFYPHFKERNKFSELKGVICLSLLISFSVGVIISLGTYMSAYWVADTFYHDQSFAPLFRIYAIAGFLVSFEGFCSSILRLHDRFIFIIIPQVVGASVSLGMIGYKLLFGEILTIRYVIWAQTISVAVNILPALLFAYICVRPFLKKNKGSIVYLLKNNRKEIVSNLFQTNLVGYLQLGSDTGGMFLLSILSTPNQVALYGIARQLSRPLQVFQNNIQNAITPEIVSLWAQNKVKQIYKISNGYTMISFFAGGILAIVIVIISKPIIILFSTQEYLDALPIFYILIVTVYLTFISIIFFPLALAMNKLGRRNLIESIRFVYLLVGILIGMNAMVLAYVQLCGILTVRLFNDLPLLRKIRQLALKG